MCTTHPKNNNTGHTHWQICFVNEWKLRHDYNNICINIRSWSSRCHHLVPEFLGFAESFERSCFYSLGFKPEQIFQITPHAYFYNTLLNEASSKVRQVVDQTENKWGEMSVIGEAAALNVAVGGVGVKQQHHAVSRVKHKQRASLQQIPIHRSAASEPRLSSPCSIYLHAAGQSVSQ